MIREAFRPWGRLELLLDQLDVERWSFIGAVSTEDRCSTALEILSGHGAQEKSLIFRIEDAPSRFYTEVERKTGLKEQDFTSLGVLGSEIRNHKLLGRHGGPLNDAMEFISNPSLENLIVDISSLPKKFFFFIIRKILEQPERLKNVIVTYTEPGSYCFESLAENPEAWNPLPGFLPPRKEPDNKVLFIGLGFEPLGLPELYSSGLFSSAKIRLLFPFPADPTGVARNWDFARLLEPVPGNASANIERVDARNVPDTFDKLVSLSEHGQIYSILAPFGPKPMSLAMCLFASAHSARENNPSVFYTQPTVYNPNYSSGVKIVDDKPMVNAYCIRLNGNNLYASLK